MSDTLLVPIYSQCDKKKEELSMASNGEDDAEDEKEYEKHLLLKKLDAYNSRWRHESLSTPSTDMMTINEYAEYCTLLSKSKLCQLARRERQDSIVLREMAHKNGFKYAHLHFWLMVVFMTTTVLFAILFGLSMGGVLKPCPKVEPVPCTPPDNLIHSFEDVVATMDTFLCPKAFDMLQGLYLDRVAKCWNFTTSTLRTPRKY